MWENTIGKQLRKGARKLFLTHLVLLIIVACVVVANQRFLVNLFSGPARVDVKALSAIKDPDSTRRYYVTVQGDKALDTGITEVEQSKSKYSDEVKSEHVTAGFPILALGGRLLIVKYSGEGTPTKYTGTLSEIPSEIQSRIVDEVDREQKGARELFFPYMLDASSSTRTAFGWGGWAGVLIGALILLFSARKLTIARRWLSDIGTHPAAQKLEKFGIATDVADQIERDLQASPTAVGAMRITPKWFLQNTTYGMTVMRTRDLVWAYQKTTQHRTNFIPTGKTYEVQVYDSNGEKLTNQMREGEVQFVLKTISDFAPWAVIGFDAQIEKYWNKDRIGFIAAVVVRREAMAAVASPTPAQPV